MLRLKMSEFPDYLKSRTPRVNFKAKTRFSKRVENYQKHPGKHPLGHTDAVVATFPEASLFQKKIVAF